MSFFIWLEGTALSIWIRESPSLWAFPFILFLHTLGMGLLVGVYVAMSLWLIRFSRDGRTAAIEPFYTVMWIGFLINSVSGLLLLVAYPAKALTNPVFYIKMLLIAVAIASLQWSRGVALEARESTLTSAQLTRARYVAAATLLVWFGAIMSGRFLAYTYTVLTATELLY
jgi:hypothetical protein